MYSTVKHILLLVIHRRKTIILATIRLRGNLLHGEAKAKKSSQKN